MDNPLSSAIASLDRIIARLEKPSSVDVVPSHDNVTGIVANGEHIPKKTAQKKQKKPKASLALVPALPDDVAQFHLCDLRVGKIVEVGHHPEADGLFALKIDVGGGEIRSVCAGLRGFLTDDEMAERFVIVICNLKPRKLRGVDSEAMCLAGSTKSDGGQKEVIVPLEPPASAEPGSFVTVSGMEGDRNVMEGKFLSGKNWDRVVPRLSVKDGKACYNGSEMIVAKSAVVCGLPDGAEIH